MVSRKSARLLELFAWVKDAVSAHISLRGDWGKFGALGKLARDVVSQVTDGGIYVPNSEMVSAAKLYTLAQAGDQQAQGIVQSMGTDPTLISIYLASELLKREDWYERSRDLCSLANQGDVGSRLVLEAVYAFKEPALNDEHEPVGITYDLTHAIASPKGSSRRMAQYINHYRHARLAPYKPDLDAFAGLLCRHSTVADPMIGSYRRGGYHTPQDLMIRTGASRW